jgi:4-aminobutyrate aminotransferase-like enzyme
MNAEEALKAALEEAEEQIFKEKNNLAALIMEPLMQGAAGMWAQPPGYVKSLSDICRTNGVILIVDEVATGFGRTGRMFACEHEGVSPDLLCLAKGLTENSRASFMGIPIQVIHWDALWHWPAWSSSKVRGPWRRCSPRFKFSRAGWNKNFSPCPM